MDRFAWSDGSLSGEEQLVHQQNGVRLYDGEQKTSFDHGKAVLTTHRLLWKDYKDEKCVLSMSLACVVFGEELSASLTKSPKIVLHLNPPAAYRAPGPVQASPNSYIRLSFKEGGQREFYRCLNEELSRKRWTLMPQSPAAQAGTAAGGQPREFRMGIGGIQKNIAKKNKETDKNITQAFEDLNKLMDRAKEMVTLAKNISTKIKDKQGDITEDETVKFKSYLMSLGIADPVTRETHGSGDKYYKELAKQLSDILEKPLKESGGMMTLTDVYCRVNRARGMELLSPEDLVNGCRQMEPLRLPVRLRVFESGVMVLQLLSHSEEAIIKETLNLVEDRGCITAEELSRQVGLSVVLAKERLLATERAGKVCRDECTEGLHFYPNLFLKQLVT